MAREKGLAKTERGELQRWDPWDTFEDMERMFRDFFTSPFPHLRSRMSMRPRFAEYMPDVDLKETENELLLSAAVPGLGKDDIDIDVTSDHITISGERKSEEDKPGEQFHVRQQTYGSFRLSYPLPTEIKTEEVKAHYKNGVLEVVMPKSEVREAHKVKVEENQ